MADGTSSEPEFAPPFAQAYQLPPEARGHVVAAKAALDALAAKSGEPPFGWRQRIALVLFAGAVGYGVVMGTLRWLAVEKAGSWIEAAVPAACALIVALVTFWPRKHTEPAEDARARVHAEAHLAMLGLAYLPAGTTQVPESQIVWAHNWQPFDPDDRESYAR
jgi:hypothetical protein